jgi:hypothetical protein
MPDGSRREGDYYLQAEGGGQVTVEVRVLV